MTEKVIGILGGMGPEATLGFFERIIAHTPATRDQEHLRVIIDSNPHVPDRTAAILLGGESPVPLMVAGVEALQRAGADFVVIPCVSAHFFLEELRRRVSLPVISMFDVTAEHIRRDHPRIKTVGLLGTTGTVAGGHFQARLAQDRIETVAPGSDDQGRVMAAIYDIKAGGGRTPRGGGGPGHRPGLHRDPAGSEDRGSRRPRVRHPDTSGPGGYRRRRPNTSLTGY
jgi:aspartate racemase